MGVNGVFLYSGETLQLITDKALIKEINPDVKIRSVKWTSIDSTRVISSSNPMFLTRDQT